MGPVCMEQRVGQIAPRFALTVGIQNPGGAEIWLRVSNPNGDRKSADIIDYLYQD